MLIRLAGTLLFILVLCEKVHYLLKSVCIIWIDYDFIKISIDASAPEDILYSIAFFLKMLCSLFSTSIICRFFVC